MRNLHQYSVCFVVKPFLQDIFAWCDLVSKGQDKGIVHPFIELSACSIHHPLCLVVWHCRLQHYVTLLPLFNHHLLLGLHHTARDILCDYKFFLLCVAFCLKKYPSQDSLLQDDQAVYN